MFARVALAFLLIAGCARSVDQHGNTGPDGFFEGAETLALSGGKGEAEGTVSYPGGDRVDWKMIELPAGQRGDLTLELDWRGPRDGTDLAMVIYDAYGAVLGEAEPALRPRNKRTGDKDLTVAEAGGVLYVVIYASRRSDAGDYQLEVSFVDRTPPPPLTIDSALQELLRKGKLVIPEPPRLAQVYPVCGERYDPQNPDCRDNPPPCDRDNPDKKNPSCKKLCNQAKLDPANPDCAQFYPVCDPDYRRYDTGNPNCTDIVPVRPPPPPPIEAKVIDVKIKNEKTTISVAIGSASPVKRGWKGTLIDAQRAPVANGDFTVISIEGKNAIGSVALNYDTANQYKKALLYYPDDYVAPEPPPP